MRLLAALVLAGVNLTLSAWVGWRLAGKMPAFLRWTAIVVVGMWLPAIAFQVLAPFHLFTLPAALIGGVVIVAALLASARQREFLHAGLRREWRGLRAIATAIRQSPRRTWLFAFAVCAVPVVLRPLAVPPLAWDTLMYHGVKASFWVQHGGPVLVLDGPGSWDFNRNLFAGGEVFMAWAMLPFHGDLLVGISQVVEWLALGLALIAIARDLGVREPWGSATAGLILSCAMVRLEVGSGYVELALGVVVAGAVAFTLRFLRRGEPGALVLACAGFGVGCGVKLIVLPIAAIGLVVLGGRALVQRRRPWLAMAAALVVFLAASLPWLAYNIADPGYPLTPAPAQVMGLTLGRATPTAVIEMMHQGVQMKPYDFDYELEHLEKTFQSPGADKEALGIQMLAPMVVFLLAFPWLFWKRPGGALFLLLVFAVNIGEIFSPGMSVVRLYWPEGVSRFWMCALIATVPASAAWCWRFPRLGRVYGWLLGGASLFMLLRLATFGCSHYSLEAMAFAALDIVAVVGVAGLLPRGWLRRVVCTALALTCFVGFAKYRNGNRYESADKETVMYGIPRDLMAAAKPLDDGPPHRIAVTAGEHQNAGNWLVYLYFGRRLQNEILYVSPTQSGRIQHDVTQVGKIASLDAWLDRLDARGIDYVVSFPPSGTELEWMDKMPERFVRMAGGEGKWGLFRFVPPLVPRSVMKAAKP